MPRNLFLLGCCLLAGVAGCKTKDKNALLVARETFAELRVVKGQVRLTEPGKRTRAPYPRERLGAGAELKLEPDSLAFIRDDHGATWLLAGPAQVRTGKRAVALEMGKAFVDTQGGPSVSLATPSGELEVAEGRSSITANANGAVEAYVLRGSLRHAALRAKAGEVLSMSHGHPAATSKMSSWIDWTSGLATADPEAQPAPYGIGTVGARSAGDQGKPRFSLVIQRLEVRVTIERDFARTEVDETFANPSADEVEGLFSFRVPPNAVLHRFGVDRDGLLVWGQTQEKRSAAAQYQANVYAGSTEDPALLEWVQRGVYQARLYPIGPGTSRRVVTRYGEWLARSGERAERRLYVYPMAATGAEGTLPRIEEMTIRVDWSKSNATTVRAPLGSIVRNKQLLLKAFDVLPKADLAVELFDAGPPSMIAYRAKHALTKQDEPRGAAEDFARTTSSREPDYLLLPLTPPIAEPTAPAEPGLDLAIVVDSSAATETSAVAVSRSLVEALLTALGPTDRAALFTGDTTLRPVLAESRQLTVLDDSRKKSWLTELSNAPLGGATDLGTLLAEAAERLEPKRRGAVIYIGDGRPSVGELLPKALYDRLSRVPPAVRIFAAGVGTQVNRTLLEGLVRGAPLETVQNGYEAAQAALRLLEAASLPAWQNVSVRLAGVDRLLPRAIPVVPAGEPALLVGRVADERLGDSLEITGSTGTRRVPIRVVQLDDDGDLRRRWGEGRLSELVEQHTGRLAIVDLARRYGLVTPWTSLYVATRKEADAESHRAIAGTELTPEQERVARAERLARWRPWGLLGGLVLQSRAAPSAEEPVAVAALEVKADDSADNKEGGTGVRAKGEEGSMGNPAAKGTNKRYAVRGPQDNPKPEVSRAAALREAQEFGLIGSLDEPASAPAEPKPAAPAPSVRGAGAVEGGGLTSIGAVGKSAAAPASAPGTGRGFGSGQGRLSGGHPARDIRRAEREQEALPKKAAPAEKAPAPQATRVVATNPMAQLSHELAPCSRASDLPFQERRKLWQERLSACSNVDCVREVYNAAIRGCEAPGWYERQLLLYGMVDRIGNVRERVQLYQSFARSPSIAEVVYRAILVRINDANGLRELHEALGIKTATPELVAGLLRRAQGSRERVKFLHGLVAQWPNDFELMLRLLEAEEDADDIAAARALARRLRRRADATAHVRTLVGEFYWRCSERETEPDKTRDLDEARRAFGEIVEFAPDDPAARRRLGDLLRAHGWYEEALRQYQTLRDLVPDDVTTDLLIAAAAQGIGKTEEALRWSEKAAATAAPDGQSDLERAANSLGSAILAWAREDAARAGRSSDAERLLLRGRKLATAQASEAGQIRFILTWEHPELRPTLYGISNRQAVLGRQMASLGIAEQVATQDEPRVELRIDPEDAERIARLSAKATLTAIVGEGTPEQRATRLRLDFGDARHPKPTIRVAYAEGVLREEATR